jgi:ATP-binding cassette subfamily B protein
MNSQLAAYVASLPVRTNAPCADPIEGSSDPGASFRQQLRSAGLTWRLAALLGTHGLETVFWFASWACVGSAVLSGRTDLAWLAAWAFCLFSVVPLRATAKWLEGVLAIGLGGLLRQRLLAGAMAMDADVLRRKGIGETLSEVFEADALENLAASGGLQFLVAGVELLGAGFVFVWATSGNWELALLLGWLLLMAIVVARNTRLRARWMRSRLGLTHRLVENMTAQRTRLAQQPFAEWHMAEDAENHAYAEISEKLDRSTARIEALFPRGYLLVAMCVVFPAFLRGSASIQQQALALGAILFAYAAIQRLANAVPRCATAYLAWQAIKPAFNAATKTIPEATPVAPCSAGNVLEMQNVYFSHGHAGDSLLKACSLAVRAGDALLLEGESGSGKSTLALLMAGARKPASGFILARGLDLQTLGEAHWRRRVAVAPQFHENHILCASLSFNLLMGRPFPHSEQDLRDAEELCHELGLGGLLERMPSGLEQIVGETGWQLSQGERSRIFLARALLQGADFVVLDESFATLDPENLRQCLACARKRAKTLMVIAHP